MMMRPAARACIGLVAVCSLGATIATAAETHKVLWQFQRAEHKLYGKELAHQLDDVRIREGDTVVFEWAEGANHDLYFTRDKQVYDDCALSGAKEISDSSSGAARGDYSAKPALGVNYYFDTQDGLRNCKVGLLKIEVHVFKAEDFVELAPTPANTVTEAPATPDTAIKVAWAPKVGAAYPTYLTVTEDDAVRFQWESNHLSLEQVTEAGYGACTFEGETVKSWSSRVPKGDVVVAGIPVGLNYFTSIGPAHCDADDVRIIINVLPGRMRLWVTLWSAPGQTTTAPIHMALTGYRANDPTGKVWTSPERQLNQRATDYDFFKYQDVDITKERSLLEVYTMDVGAINAIRLRRSVENGEKKNTWLATRIRIDKRDQGVQSQTFECAAMQELNDGATDSTQYCILVPGEGGAPASTSVAKPSSPASAAESCTCYRDFAVEQGRVLTCTSDGCFSTNADASSGWSDMHEIARLVGVGTDSGLYGTSADNVTMVSRNAGLSWSASHHDVKIQHPVMNYYFDVNHLTTTPKDEHVIHGRSYYEQRAIGTSIDWDVEWGVTSQGVHYNKQGDWTLHALWACKCDGACGLKCNQPAPNLI